MSKHNNKPTPHLILIGVMLCLALTNLTSCASGKPDKKTLDKAHYHYQLSANFFREKMVPQTLRELENTLKLNPDHPDALHLMGFVYMGRRNYSLAVSYYRRALEARSNFYICRNNLGTALMAMNRWDEAIALYEELITRPVYNTPELAYNNLGWSYYKKGNEQQAAEALEMAIFLKPEMCLAHNNLGLVTKKDNPVGALKHFMKATTLCPTYPEPYFHSGQMLRERQDPRARSFYQRCYELAPESTWGERCMAYLSVYP